MCDRAETYPDSWAFAWIRTRIILRTCVLFDFSCFTGYATGISLLLFDATGICQLWFDDFLVANLCFADKITCFA